MKKVNSVICMILIFILTVSFAISAEAAESGTWRQSNGRWWYEYKKGGYPYSQWLQDKNIWYYFDSEGWMVTGWKQIGGKWYWFANSGAMKTNGWVDGLYYVGSDGAMLTSCKTPDGYYVNSSGAWVGYAGWKSSGDRWWYMNEDGSWPANDWKKVKDSWYWFDQSGLMVTGWRQINGKWYWFANSGAMGVSRWVGNYYLGYDGAMLTSTTTPDGYKVGADGAWIR